ncbi:hypothetical protein QLQ80_01100 [Mycoplasma sp. M5725]|uniref:Uncharacterized protein n=1 Tax=Mycoplasma phocimorsus TaxID=3045839 RepID=A0AAJ1UVM7_9MOLU|nr:hypothetical protein [Mycoplasma phocimorsus]MDJ1645689.1 hypothetical protein [Mycoplasma phocimorsus]
MLEINNKEIALLEFNKKPFFNNIESITNNQSITGKNYDAFKTLLVVQRKKKIDCTCANYDVIYIDLPLILNQQKIMAI